MALGSLDLHSMQGRHSTSNCSGPPTDLHSSPCCTMSDCSTLPCVLQYLGSTSKSHGVLTAERINRKDGNAWSSDPNLDAHQPLTGAFGGLHSLLKGALEHQLVRRREQASQALHHLEVVKYYQRTSKVHPRVLEDLVVCISSDFIGMVTLSTWILGDTQAQGCNFS